MIFLQNTLTLVLILAGSFFILVGSIGVIRLPDFFTRSHAIGKSDTLGILLIIAGLMVFEGFTLNSVKLLLIFIFVALVNPVAIHALAREAFNKGLKPWSQQEEEQ